MPLTQNPMASTKNHSIAAVNGRLSVEEQLRQLVTEAQKYPPGHFNRQKSLTQIVRLIGQSRKLWFENTPYYEDALQQTWAFFCQNVCEPGTGEQYDPSRSSVITWLNQYLKWRLKDFRKAYQTQRGQTMSTWTSGIIPKTSDPTVNLVAPPEIPPILEDTRRWAEIDLTGELASTHIQDRPDVTCQALILKRLPPETPWEQLSTEFDISISTLSSFYQRQCMPRLRSFGTSHGYLDSEVA